MKVYAEYFTTHNGERYRRKTLLKFGSSLNLIGSAVLINPGSANPIGEADNGFISDYYTSIHSNDKMDVNSWREFSSDPTMIQLDKIFNGWYTNQHRRLNGVIQLFNCFYYKNQNLDKALKNYDVNSGFIFNEYEFFLDKPVYFGWRNTGKNGLLRETAETIFSRYDTSNTPIYHNDFEKNPFYHPGYVNRSYKRSQVTKELITKFNSLF